MTFKYQMKVLEKHLDSFGHVNNSVYLEMIEEARWDFITEGGYGLEFVQKEQKGPVVLEMHIKYRRELKNREDITIESKTISTTPSKIMKIEQRILKSNGEVSFTAELTVGFMDLKERKLIDPPDYWIKAIGL